MSGPRQRYYHCPLASYRELKEQWLENNELRTKIPMIEEALKTSSMQTGQISTQRSSLEGKCREVESKSELPLRVLEHALQLALEHPFERHEQVPARRTVEPQSLDLTGPLLCAQFNCNRTLLYQQPRTVNPCVAPLLASRPLCASRCLAPSFHAPGVFKRLFRGF